MNSHHPSYSRSSIVFQVGRYSWVGIFSFLLVLGCTTVEEDTSLESSLQKAGNNRKELEKVLNHYSGHADSLKYRAAEFLIRNLDIQYSMTSDQAPLILEHLMHTEGMTELMASQYLDSIRATLPFKKIQHKRTVIRDIEVITADYLIENIDQAFSAWLNAPWHDDIDFNTFCQYILPYKSGNAPIQLWRENYHDALIPHVEAVSRSGRMMDATDTLLASQRPKFRYKSYLALAGELGPNDLLDTRIGHCYQWSHTVNYMLRDFAIPSVLIYSPQWSNFPAGHAWNGILDSAGQWQGYAIEYNIPYVFNPMRWPLKTAKLYMQPFARNDSSFAIIAAQRKIEDVPDNLQDVRMVDVTARFVPVVDLPVIIKNAPTRQQNFLFLCVFGRGDYAAVDWAEISDGHVVFSDVGVDGVYLPAFYYDKKYYPATDPSIVSYDGDITSVIADTTDLRSVRLYRKYPLKNSMFRYTQPFYGMKIQVSNDREFTVPIDKHEITRYPSPVLTDPSRQRDRWRWEEYRDSVVFDSPLKAQYLRFIAAPSKECIVGEIECFDENGLIIKGQPYGSKPGAEHVQDGLYGECYHDPDSLGWVAIDFGKNVTISKISYLPSNDSNSIQVGERYELRYWDDKWISLGEQVATHKFLDYNVPAGALFWLRNLDTGKEERMFTLDEKGVQVWW